ncbi:histidinol-phosphate transaminase [Bacillus sp. Bva_UNVM-123]
MMKIERRKIVEKIYSYPLGYSLDEIKKIYKLQTVRKMSENENVYGCSKHVQEAIFQKLAHISLYPDGRALAVRKMLATTYGINEEKILLGNGSDEIIRLICRAFLNQGDEAIIADVTFPRYESNVTIEGGIPIVIPLIRGVHDLEAMYKGVTSKTKLIFICNPNNPTGTIVGKQELLHFIEKVPPNILIILDEAYYEYVTSTEYLPSISLLDKHPNLIILRTFSKIYGLAGLRIGYGMMSPSIVLDLQKVKEVFNVNEIAQTAAVAALADQDFVMDCARKNTIEREYMCEHLQELGLAFYSSETNFIYVMSHYPVFHKLIEHGFLVRQMKAAGYKDALRITLGTREDNEAFLAVLKELISEEAV